MKFIYLAFFVFLFLGCKAQNKAVVVEKNYASEANCPTDGNCSFQVLNRRIINNVEGSLGEFYVEIIEGNMLVLKFEYRRNEIANTVDGHYIEQVFFQLDKNNLHLDIKDSELEKVNAVFSRFCYCKGQTGYYHIKNGMFSLKKTLENTYQLNFDFKVDEVPQVITKIHETFSLED